MMSLAAKLARPEILALRPPVLNPTPMGWTRLHANENPYPAPGARDANVRWYPEPYPDALEAGLAECYGVAANQIIATRGSDEAIDLLVRAFCAAGHDGVLVFPPTFGMYEVSAQIQGAQVHRGLVTKQRGFALDEALVVSAYVPGTKLIFLCSPNNPTGNLVAPEVVEAVLARYAGTALVVLDEAYIEFAGAASFASRLGEFENLVVLRTLSKAYGLAGARCGAALANPAIVDVLRRLRPPYALASSTVADVALLMTKERREHATQSMGRLRTERERMFRALSECPLVRKVWPSEANFLLVECTDAGAVIDGAARAKILLRDFRSTPGLEDCVRITIGSKEDNDRLLAAMVGP
jgi:histidinol-phosphate aminotransferase